MQVSPCPVSSSTPDCPGLPTLEGAEAALRLLGTACRSWRCRWLLDAHLNLADRLKQQLEKQGAHSCCSCLLKLGSAYHTADRTCDRICVLACPSVCLSAFVSICIHVVVSDAEDHSSLASHVQLSTTKAMGVTP